MRYPWLSIAIFTLVACPGRGNDSDTATMSTTSTTTSTTNETTAETTSSTGSTGSTTQTTAPTSTTSTTGAVVPCGATRLPPDGSACANEGEVCTLVEAWCVPFTGAICEGGVWAHFEDTPSEACGACEPPDFPEEGTPCFPEGASCSSDCSDQCSFCSAWQCENGEWQRLEVHPLDCLECEELCDFVVVPMCPGGPPDKAACVSGCEDNKVGACKAEFSHLRACAGSQPMVTCDQEGRPLVEGCESQFAKFYDCIML